MDSSLSSRHCSIRSLWAWTLFGWVRRILDIAISPRYFTTHTEHTKTVLSFLPVYHSLLLLRSSAIVCHRMTFFGLFLLVYQVYFTSGNTFWFTTVYCSWGYCNWFTTVTSSWGYLFLLVYHGLMFLKLLQLVYHSLLYLALFLSHFQNDLH